jgi:hypothetical protein
MVAIQTAVRIQELRVIGEQETLPQQAELRRLLQDYRAATVLMGVGEDPRSSTLMSRHEMVFAGHPIGIDSAALMDYRRAGLPEPNLDKLESDLQQRTQREIVWIVPRGEPFSAGNFYDDKPLFSDEFRRAFHKEYRVAERTAFFDVYRRAGGEPEAGATKESSRPLTARHGCERRRTGAGARR